MKPFLKKYLYLILAVSCFLLVVFLENGYIWRSPEKVLLKNFQKEIIKKEAKLKSYLDEITGTLDDSIFDGNYLQAFQSYNELLEKGGYGFLIFENRELVYWSDRSISFFDFLTKSDVDDHLWRLPNGYYLKKEIPIENHIVVGLIMLKHDYAHENKYLENSFHKDFGLPNDFLIERYKSEKSSPIHGVEGKHLFSLLLENELLDTKTQLYLPCILYLLALLFLFVFFRKEMGRRGMEPVAKLLILGTALFLIYWVHIILKIPNVFYDLEFFSPGYFAYNLWLPSLGDHLLLSIFFFFWALNFNFDMNLKRLSSSLSISSNVIIALMLSFCGILFLLVNKAIYVLIYNSSISFSLNRINDLSAHSVFGFISIAILMLGLFLITARIVEEIGKILSRKKMALGILAMALLLLVLQLIFSQDVSLPIVLYFIATLLLLVLMNSKYFHKFTLSYLIIFISVATLYALAIINTTSLKKKNEAQKLLSMNLVAEHEPAVEFLLYNLQEEINTDSIIPKLLIPPYEDLRIYIANKYFDDFFTSYDLQITTCDGSDQLVIQPDSLVVPCFPFFKEMVKEEGILVAGTNFYFMDRMNGRITYFGELHYPWAPSTDSLGISVFIELISNLSSEGLGYPELLLDKAMEKPSSYKNFSYAKYYDGVLVDNHGEFLYNHYLESYTLADAVISTNIWDGHRHVIYKTDVGNYVIVSREVFDFVDYLISFPYLFVFFFILSITFLMIGNHKIRMKTIHFDLRFKIQASIIAIVFISLMVVALSTIFYNVEEYQTKHRDDLNEKMKSIAEEIDMRLNDKTEVNEETQIWMYKELAKLSNVFRTDINIYGNDGNLLATSREEVYQRGLISSKINAQAYYELFQNYEVNYFQPEQIGELSYLSSYEPIINNNNQYLGIINLPYFTRQDKYNQEISTFIVAFINLYVILFLASIIIAVFISNQITRPLILIREKLRHIELGKRNEPLNYKGDDEIGLLAKEYNKKVDELSVSAELIARSERESAWREMAKQIAHEIKNPLTPMKLNIQYLQRSLEKSGKKDKYFERVTKTLIEQIDNLSAISTEFSNFAQIPTARNQVFNLSEQIKKVIDLFETHDRAYISFETEDTENIQVNADREQLGRAIINLVKNGIQAIPAGFKGNIDIKLIKKDYHALISVKDNGTGIAEELRDKLFRPSFTTKTSGMGLGLSIVKSIVENFKGRIWFETEINKGSTFFVEIPIYDAIKLNETNNDI